MSFSGTEFGLAVILAIVVGWLFGARGMMDHYEDKKKKAAEAAK